MAALNAEGKSTDKEAVLKYDCVFAVVAVVQALRKLVTKAMPEKLEAADRYLAQAPTDVGLSTKSELLSYFHPNFWAMCFIDFLPRGDSQERSQHLVFVRDDVWAKALLTRAYFRP